MCRLPGLGGCREAKKLRQAILQRSIARKAMLSKTVDRLSSSLKSRGLSMRGGTRRRAKTVLRAQARSVTARRAVAAKINNRRGPPGAVTESQKTTITKRTTNLATNIFGKLQRPCA